MQIEWILRQNISRLSSTLRATGAFNRNPIGVMFDMDEAIKAFREGCPVAEVVSPRALKVGDHTEAELRAGKMAPLDAAGRAPRAGKPGKKS